MENIHEYNAKEFSQVVSLKDFFLDMKIVMDYAGQFLKTPYMLLIDLNGFNRTEAENFISLYEGIRGEINPN